MAEISRLRDELVRRAGETPGECPQGLVIARMCAGLTLDQWEEIAREGHFLQWLALPACGDATPHLERIQRTIEELAHQTRQDPLTGLANRRAFERNLKMELDRAYRGGTPVSLAILDLDDFKAVNDRFGHPCGDRVLLSLAGALLGHKRIYDMAARIGGEEFALVLPGSGLAQAETTLERILQEIRQRKVACDGVDPAVGVTCSAGVVCTKGRAPVSVEQFVDLADKALYEAKRQGKDRLVKAPIPDLFDTSRATLVHAQEKKFLFTGPDT
ncbi:Diguanylate cyclase DosC [Fundidesulfovibrio magnetotacticus]|uniref:diguanylate cyclase n=1 Tax=Fundidesulfovibrio magnetotacticus TaxID=2730080 RepID=A0A6V8LRQ3_9BACT|nr:GGDEF domain-containing protein [Fundidesulfovibrio magnetotacticus]GFK95153.1 Diguanylate cyclase DosC [Fundidesulfovibrio magnetotacticus]